MNGEEIKKDGNFKLDLGCGNSKKEGTIGIDIEKADGVDYVLDIQNQPLPFPDQSVEYIYSSHFLEHIDNPGQVFQEVSRVAKNGAELEIWTPYAWTNDAFIFGHKFYFTEELYLHLCWKYPEIWEEIFQARWTLREIVYVVHPSTILELHENGISLDFAIKHYINIVAEIGIFIEISHYNRPPVTTPPKESFAFTRYSERYPLKVNHKKEQQKSLLTKIRMAQALLKEMGLKNFVQFLRNKDSIFNNSK